MSPASTTPREPETLDDLAGAHRFTVDEYHRMLDAGVLYGGEPVELIEGYVFHKSDRTPPPIVPNGFSRWRWLRQFTVEEYHKLIAGGILTPDDRVELLEGYVVDKMPQDTPHGGTLTRLSVRVSRRLPDGWVWRTQQPITLPTGEPEPDFAVVRGDETSFDARHPDPADLGIVFEVADSSLVKDRRDKGRAYARVGIPVYWVLNVADRVVEVYTDPDPTADPPAYRARTDYPAGQDVPLVLDGVTVAVLPVADLFPT